MVARAATSEEQIWRLLGEVPDPEVPAISVVDLGIVRRVVMGETPGDEVVVEVTPTYSGCPATFEIERAIVQMLAAHDVPARVKTVFSPPWTTDWMSDAAREKLRAYGIAPPGRSDEVSLVPLLRRAPAVACPFCGSRETETKSAFGSTACKSLHYCNACRQPFEHFKAI